MELLIDGTEQVQEQLQLIHHLQRLDISHYFSDRVQKLLADIYDTMGSDQGSHHAETWDLYATALQFRLLRQAGYHVPQGDCTFSFSSINN